MPEVAALGVAVSEVAASEETEAGETTEGIIVGTTEASGVTTGAIKTSATHSVSSSAPPLPTIKLSSYTLAARVSRAVVAFMHVVHECVAEW